MFKKRPKQHKTSLNKQTDWFVLFMIPVLSLCLYVSVYLIMTNHIPEFVKLLTGWIK